MTDLVAPTAHGTDHGAVGGGRYRVGEQLGRGRTSSVHAAYDERLRRPVAVRFFDDFFDGHVATRTVAAASSAWSPGMSRVLDFDTDGARVYLVRELVVGQSLRQLTSDIERRPSTIAAVGLGVAATLAALHRDGAAHGAIHAGNIFVRDLAPWQDWDVDDEHVTVVTDHGLGARPADRCDPRDDVRDLGVALLGVLTGHAVLGARTTRAALDRLRRGRLPSDWTDVLTVMTDVDPSRRPSAVDAISLLATLQHH